MPNMARQTIKGCPRSQTVQAIEEVDGVRDGNHPENRYRN